MLQIGTIGSLKFYPKVNKNNISMNLAFNYVLLTAPDMCIISDSICILNIRIFQQKPDSLKLYLVWHFDPKLLTLKLTSLIIDQLRMLKTTCSEQSFATTNTPILFSCSLTVAQATSLAPSWEEKKRNILHF